MSKLSVEYINPFIQAAIHALSVMAGVQASKTKLTVKDDAEAQYDISGIIGLAGDVVGSVVLSFPRGTACKIVSKFLDTKKVVLDSEAQSAIGELTNMIAGGAKRELTEQGFGFKIGLPNVVVGQGHQVVRPKNVPTIVIHFTSEEGEFVVEVCLKTTNGSGGGSFLTQD